LSGLKEAQIRGLGIVSLILVLFALAKLWLLR